jgi:hypothetical protein
MRKAFVIIGFLFIVIGAKAQKSYDYGLFLGMTESHGDFSILPIPDTSGFGYAAGGYYRYSMNERYSWRGGVNMGFDRFTMNPNLVDAFGLFEFNFHPLSPKREKKLVSSYISVGLSYLIDLQLLKAVPNIPNAKMTNFMIRNIRIPFNVGVRYNATPNLTLGVEWAIRKGYQLDYYGALPYGSLPKPEYNNLLSNWRSHIGVTVGYMVSNYCRTCPFYDNERKKLK